MKTVSIFNQVLGPVMRGPSSSHTATAFVNADLVLGGYTNFIPLDETIDAVYAVGLAMPSELRCTSKGGLAITPSAQALKPGCCGSGCVTCQ